MDQPSLIPGEVAASPTELAYVTGLFDGEGTIALKKDNVGKGHLSYVLRIRIAMTDRKPIDLCARFFGGKVHYRKRSQENQADLYLWQLDGQRAGHFLEAVRPFLLVKAEEADLGLNFLKEYPHPGKGIRGFGFRKEGVGERFKKALAAHHGSRANIPEGRRRVIPLCCPLSPFFSSDALLPALTLLSLA